MQAFLKFWKVGESQFKHCGGAVQLIQACLHDGKVSQSHLNHCGDAEMLKITR